MRKTGVVLFGGKKPRMVSGITRYGVLSAGTGEAKTVHEVLVEVGNKKKRYLEMAEKEFYESGGRRGDTFKNPSAHLQMFNTLKKLNREKNLGLNILPTMRLRRVRGKKPTLIVTKLNGFKSLGALTQEELKQYLQDVSRQETIAKREGITLAQPNFFPIKLQNGKITAMIVDMHIYTE